MTCLSYEVEGWGVGELWANDGRLVWHELPRPRPHRGTRARARVTPTRKGGGNRPPPSRSTLAPKARHGSNGSEPKAHELVHRVQSYFAGEAASFSDIELQLDDWTPFQLDVLRTLREVRYGEVVSYAELARLAGHPRAQRAAGTFCAHNRFGLVVPCHRVVGTNGLGSYGSLGLDYKRRLLELEGVEV